MSDDEDDFGEAPRSFAAAYAEQRSIVLAAAAAAATRAPTPPRYGVIVMDPPWPERGGGKIKRGADRHYKTIKKISDIVEVVVRAPVWHVADDALLFMWSTMSSLTKSLWLMDAIGFKYTTHSVWVKADEPNGEADEAEELDHVDTGIGQYFRGAHELLLMGTRGSGFAVKSALRNIPSVFYARTRAGGDRIHSRKPDKAYRIIEARTVAERRLDMFARVPRGPTWDLWGDEAPALTDGQ